VPLIGRTFEEMLREGLRTGHFADEIAQQDPEQWLASRMAFHRTPAGKPIEQQLTNGRWILIHERPTKDGGTVGIRSDITALKQREFELAELAGRLDNEKQRAENANAAKTSFLATISHELRTPMTGVIGMVDLLRTTELNPQQLHYTDLLQSSAQSLMGLLNDMLDLSKIEAGRLELEVIDLDLYHLVRDVIDLFRPRAEEKRIGIGYHFDRDVPSLIQGDPTRLRQILFNLVSNAVKFTESGSVQVKVHAEPGPNQVINMVFSVQDTGIGMSPDQITTIFEPFQQAEISTTRRYGGSGLGLAICQKLVTAMDGHIDVISKPTIGTTFNVFIQVAAATTKVLLPTESTPSIILEKITDNSPVTTITTRPMNILLAEDNQTTLLLVRSILDRCGHRVICVPNGKAAVEAIQHNDIDIILMDSHMPDMDGATATREIRQLKPPLNNIPIYGLTADIMPEKIDQLLTAGMNGILPKPIDWAALDRALAKEHHNQPIVMSPAPETPAPETPASPTLPEAPKGIDPVKWHDMIDLLGNADARGLCLHGILDAEEMISQIGELLTLDPKRPGREGDYFRLVHTLEGLFGNIGALEWASLARKLHQDEFTTHRLEWLELIRVGLTELYDSLQS
jgi:signal transduction histidine kinase/CheY-like chemotaxis protein